MDQPNNPNQSTNIVYRFDNYSLDQKHRVLRNGNGEQVQISSRAFDTLLCLVKHAGEVVSKDELLNTVWPHTVVDENNINQAVSVLRKTFGRDRKIILTVPGRGYSFVGDVDIDTDADVIPAPDAGGFDPAPGPREHNRHNIKIIIPKLNSAILISSILIALVSLFFFYWANRLVAARENSADTAYLAVAPFVELDNPGRQSVLTRGLQQEYIARLMADTGLQVYSTVFNDAFGDVAGSAYTGPPDNISHTLRTTVRIEGDYVRVSQQLIDADSFRYLWSETTRFSLAGFDNPADALAEALAAQTLQALRATYPDRK